MKRALLCLAAIFMLALQVSSAAPQGKAKPGDCLLYGNVFTADGHLFEGAEVHVRRAADKKPKWEAFSDRRGEFAVRVPPEGDYVVEVKAKGFVTQTRTMTAQVGTRLEMVFHMAAENGKKQ
ncbi:MAG TPA: carboxypeptidase-like regulatory domain-containing protein [Candidatus Acidoferrales bacterium]|nr:carboxypeptidase-like regulatory domain-containing protein [Candidatus Acidoferrales bacterium]